MTAKKATTRGKPMNLYMRPDDVAKIRELTAYAAENEQRTSDSKIVRAALRAAKTDRAFLAALKEAESADLRYKPNESK
jgi:hypothetical protein